MAIFWLASVYSDQGFDIPETSPTYFYNVNTFTANLGSFLRVQRAAVRWSSTAAEASVVGGVGTSVLAQWLNDPLSVSVEKTRTITYRDKQDLEHGFQFIPNRSACLSFKALLLSLFSRSVTFSLLHHALPSGSLSYSLGVFIFSLTGAMAMFGQCGRSQELWWGARALNCSSITRNSNKGMYHKSKGGYERQTCLYQPPRMSRKFNSTTWSVHKAWQFRELALMRNGSETGGKYTGDC